MMLVVNIVDALGLGPMSFNLNWSRVLTRDSVVEYHYYCLRQEVLRSVVFVGYFSSLVYSFIDVIQSNNACVLTVHF